MKGVTPAELLADLPVMPEEYTVRIVEGLDRPSSEVDRLVTSAFGRLGDRADAGG